MPRVSIFTPSHDFTHLPALHRSLALQGFKDFEWVLVPNGAAASLPVPPSLIADPRVRVIRGYAGSTRIGELKAFAAKHCRGDVLLEADHDDLLIQGALERTVAAFDAGAGFVWTDSACFNA